MEKKKNPSMSVEQLKTKFFEEVTLLLREGVIDDQFIRLWQLQDEKDPDFVSKVLSIFFEDTNKLIDVLSQALDQQSVDYKKVAADVLTVKGSSAWIGAKRVKSVCDLFPQCCEEQNTEQCLKCLQQLRHEFSYLKNKFESLLKSGSCGTSTLGKYSSKLNG